VLWLEPVMMWIRSRASFSNAVSLVALFLAFTGGAYAAAGNPFVGAHGSIQGCVKKGALDLVKSGKRCPKHTTSLAFSQAGVQGIQGAQGAQGVQGKQGDQGLEGPAGPLLSQLPSGSTETGVYGTVFLVPSSGPGGGADASISFPIPLADAPTANMISSGQSPTAACPGSVTAPSAAAGELCIYEGYHSNESGHEIVDPETGNYGANKYGATIYVEPGSVTGENGWSDGTWAVTAP
jgi:hypothetical protein